MNDITGPELEAIRKRSEAYRWAIRVGVRVETRRVVGSSLTSRVYSVPGYGPCDLTIAPWPDTDEAHGNALSDLKARCDALDEFHAGAVAASFAPPVFLP